MRTFSRICIKDYCIEAENGDKLELKRGKEYLTSDIKQGSQVVVFSTFWVPVPMELFAGEEIFTPT